MYFQEIWLRRPSLGWCRINVADLYLMTLDLHVQLPHPLDQSLLSSSDTSMQYSGNTHFSQVTGGYLEVADKSLGRCDWSFRLLVCLKNKPCL